MSGEIGETETWMEILPRALKAEREVEEARVALGDLLDLREWLQDQAQSGEGDRADAYRIVAGASAWNRAADWAALAAEERP